MADNLQENEKTSYLKGFIITFLAFLFIPIVTMIIMYFTNDNFHYATNNTLTALPGVLGEHFKSLPTKEEKENIKLQIAKYYIDLDEDRLLDKLLIIKGEDEELYNDLLILLYTVSETMTSLSKIGILPSFKLRLSSNLAIVPYSKV